MLPSPMSANRSSATEAWRRAEHTVHIGAVHDANVSIWIALGIRLWEWAVSLGVQIVEKRSQGETLSIWLRITPCICQSAESGPLESSSVVVARP